MRDKHFLYVLFFVLTMQTAAGSAEYTIGEIADSLKRNAGAVVRLDDVTLTISDTHKYTYSEEKVVSVLNTSQEDLAGVTLYYDEKRESIKSFQAWIYDADGKSVKHLNKTDAAEYSATPGYVLIGSERVKYWDLKRLKPPYTIHYIYETETNGTFQLPEWMPVATPGVSIEHARFHVDCSNRFLMNVTVAGLPKDTINKHNFLWEITGFCALKKIEYAPGSRALLPHVSLMAKEFELYGYTGRSDSWNDIGVFMNTLMKGREVLNTIDETKLNDIINSNTDQKEKVRLIYKYLQNSFRYVCISLGIGGWQPQDASFTMQKKYGDCKALSLVMKAMLKKAGIESCLTLIKAGGEHINLSPDFPNSNFNHAILCVPLPNDTIWLECTSQNSPFNYLGNFTGNRQALMIFDGGARVVRTPVYAENNNLSHSKALIKPNEDNSVSISASVTKESELQDNLRAVIDLKDAKNIEAAIYDAAHIKNTTINSYSITRVEPDRPEVSFSLDLRNESTVKKTESRMFIKTDLFMPITSIPEKNDHRTQTVHVATGYTQSDTLIYTLPAGYAPESFKADDVKEFTDQFGYANCSITYSAATGELRLVRNFCLKQATYPAADYSAFREFLLKASKQCCPELVLKKQG